MTISRKEIMRRMRIVGMDVMDTELEKQPFCFLMLGHFGNWEWISSTALWSKRPVPNSTHRYITRLSTKCFTKCAAALATKTFRNTMRCAAF